jgi:hypothetical protein
VLDAFELVVLGRGLAGAEQPAGQRLVERLDHQRRLAAAGNAGDAGKRSERDLEIDVLQVVGAGADHLDRLALATLAPAGRDRDLPHAGQVLAGDALGVAHHFGRRADGDDLAAMDAGARSHVDQIVGRADRVLVVLDDDHRVAEVAETLERLQEARIVALVQPDRRLVQHIEHAGQA